MLLIFLGYFLFQPRLPIRRNRLFFGLLFLQIAVILFDILSSRADNEPLNTTIFLSWLLNMAFFVLFFARIFWFFLFTMNLTGAFPERKKWVRMGLYSLVLIVCVLITLSSVLTGAVFRIDADGYHRGPLYGILYVCAWFYLLLSAALLAAHRRRLSRSELISAVLYNAILAVGYVARYLWPNVLVMNFFCLMAITVIIFAFENPAIYVSTSGGYTFGGLHELIGERINHSGFRVLGFAVRNYADAQAVYGFKQIEQGVTLICRYMMERYPTLEFFYLRAGCFALVGPRSMDVERLSGEIAGRFHQPWVSDETELFLDIAFVHISPDSGLDTADKIMETLMLALVSIGKREGATNMLLDLDNSCLLEREVQVKRALEQAVEENRVEVFLQPLVDAGTGALVAAEALARLRDEHGALIPPGEFISMAEKNGQINRLGEQVLEKVCAFIHEHGMKDLGLQWINVNLSPVQCMNRELCSRFTEILQRYEVEPRWVHLEITEESMIDSRLLMGQMSELWKAGFCFALDDYGSGYSNLSRVKRFPFSNIKLDMDVVQAHCKDPDAVLPTFVELFKEKGFTITAEGIETEEIAREMRDIGCDYLQGYYYSRPLPLTEFLVKYKT